MEIIVENGNVKGFDTNKETPIIKERIKETLSKHPFFEGLDKPNLVRVWVKMGLKENTQIEVYSTQIDHSLFSEWGVVILYLFEKNIRPNYNPYAARKPHELDREKIDKVLYHEFGHFIDARLDSAFGYKEKELKCQPYRNIYNILWNSYIDGRLKERAPFSLKYRIKKGRDGIKINSEHIEIKSVFIEKAWNKEFTTHKEILDKTIEIYEKFKKESDDKKANI